METELKNNQYLFAISEKIPYYLYKKHRLLTFKGWPYKKKSKCNAEKMASSGFVYAPNKECNDVAICIICWKELEGWDSDDNPIDEHRKHSPSCILFNYSLDLDINSKHTLNTISTLLTHSFNNFMEKFFENFEKGWEKKRDEILKTLNRYYKK